MSEREVKGKRLENLINQAEYRITLCGKPSTGFDEYSSIMERAKGLYFAQAQYNDAKFNPLFEGIMKDFSELESRLKDIFEDIEKRRSQQQPKSELQIKLPDQEGQTTFKLSRGGSRGGAGRKKIGITTKVSVTLEQADWDFIDECVQHDSAVNSRSAFFRMLYLMAYHPNSQRSMEFSGGRGAK